MKLSGRLDKLAKLKKPADLGSGPVLSTLVLLALPSIAMMIMNTLFNLVDTVFISWLGEKYLVSISYTFPVQIGVFAMLEGVGNGMTQLRLSADNSLSSLSLPIHVRRLFPRARRL